MRSRRRSRRWSPRAGHQLLCRSAVVLGFVRSVQMASFLGFVTLSDVGIASSFPDVGIATFFRCRVESICVDV
jgi:hypothetical protein